MEDTRGMSRRIKDALVAILSGLEYQGETAFVSVLDNTRGEFDGYPSLRVLPGELSSESSDSADMDHTVEYAAIMHFKLQTTDEIESETYDRMYDYTDLIMNTLEQADTRRTLSEIDPDIQSWMLSVPNARWFVGQSASGALLLCNVVVQVSYSQLTV